MTDPHHERRWRILAVIGIAQLLVVLDVTIVNIALPSAQADLAASYTTAFWWAAAIFALGGLVSGGLLRSRVRATGARGPAEPVAA